jgi:hypothetical protein
MTISPYHIIESMGQLCTSSEDIYALATQRLVWTGLGAPNGGGKRDQILFATVVTQAPVTLQTDDQPMLSGTRSLL